MHGENMDVVCASYGCPVCRGLVVASPRRAVTTLSRLQPIGFDISPLTLVESRISVDRTFELVRTRHENEECGFLANINENAWRDGLADRPGR